MYKITFVRLFKIEHCRKCGYMGCHPNKGFFKKEFNSLEEAVKFVVAPLLIFGQSHLTTLMNKTSEFFVVK